MKTPTILQMEATECGAASLAMVLAAHGRYVPLEELRAVCGVSRDGAKMGNIARAARSYGLTARGKRMEPDRLRDLPLPFIVHWGLNHFLVVEGFRGNEVLLNDPAVGRRRVSAEEFSGNFTGLALALEPGPDFAPAGRAPGTIGPLVGMLRGTGSALAFVLVVSLGLVLPGVALPALVRSFVDGYLVHGTTAWLGPLLAGLILAAAVSAILTWLQQRYLLRLEAKLALGTSGRFVWHVLRLPVEFYMQRFAGEVSSRVEIIDQLARLLSGELATAALNVATIGFFAVVMLFYDPGLTLVAVVAAAVDFLALRLVAQRRRDASARVQVERGRVIGTAMRGLQIIETLKASASESDFFARWAGQYAGLAEAEQEVGLSARVLGVLPPLLTALSIAAVLGVGGWRVLHHSLTVGMLVAFQMLTASFLLPVGRLVALGSSLQEVQGGLRRLEDVIEYQTDPQVGAPRETDGDQPLKLEGRVELRGVTFGYNRNEPPLLEKLDLTIAPGRRVAIVGGSGSGKSTVARLVCGLFEPWEGEVLLDGSPRRAIPRDLLARSVALVDQDIFLLEGTVRENIALWDPTLPESRILAAARDASVHADVAARPGGYESLVEEGGRNFSGGQRQRLEIARALAIEPTVLVLDEATSALDPVTELRIDAAVRRRGCTSLIIAHRLSTIRDADEIVVLDRGKIVERGTHGELFAAGGRYAQLVRAEAAEEAAADVAATVAAATGAPVAPVPSPPRGAASDPPAYERAESDGAEWDRLRRLAEFERDAPRRVALRFAEAVEHPGAARASAPGEDDLLRAVRIVAGSVGFGVVAPLREARGDAPADAVERIARASRVRHRRVKLPDLWWRHDGGAFVGLLADDGRRPVALVPRSPGRYTLVDPRSGASAAVDDALAGRIEPFGHVFYRPLPERAISLRELIRFGVRGTRGDMVRAVLAGLAAGAVALAVPLGAGALVGSIIPRGDEHGLVTLSIVLIVAAVAAALASVTRAVAVLRAETRFDHAVQSAVWDRLLRLPTTFFRRYSAGDLATRAMGVAALRMVLSDAVSTSFFTAVAALVSGVLLFVIAPTLAAIAVTFVLIGAGAALAVQQRQLRHERGLAEARGRVTGVVLQLLTGIPKLRVAGAELRAFELWAAEFAVQRRAALEARRAANAIAVFAPVWPILTVAALVAAVMALGPPEPGAFVAFFVALEQFTAGLAGVVLVLAPVAQALPYLERLRPLLAIEPEVDALRADPGVLSGAVEIASVSFRYDRGGPLVLDSVAIRAEPGQFVAIVGPSGSGKSSLFRLLLGFERPEAGSIYYDAQDLARQDVAAVRRQMGVVLQTGALVPGDILTNIVGESTLTMDDAWEAARMAGLDEDIRRMPMGMFTVIGEGASTISGGQRQRILIARALARRPRILLFDEATSALDNETQAVVSASLERLRATRIVIAHRLSTIQKADVIYVVDRGRVVQSGRFDDLMQQGGLFAEMALRQLA